MHDIQQNNETEEYVDSKAIEEKAITYLRTFVEDSKRISQFITDNDREPCWDGHLYLYSGGKRDKQHLVGRVPVQVKGIEVEEFQTEKWKYRLNKLDLQAYLHEPTFFIVCQVKKSSKEKKLFYKELLPNTVRTLLNDMGNNESRKTVFHPLSDSLKDLEDKLFVFYQNSSKMASFADKQLPTIDEIVKKGINEFSFVAPVNFSNRFKLLSYLTTHETHLYAKISKEFDVDMPLATGPVNFTFKREEKEEIKVGNLVFYTEYQNEIKEGRMVLSIPGVMVLTLPINDDDTNPPTFKVQSHSKYLQDAIKNREFALALNKTGVFSIGDAVFNLNIKNEEFTVQLKDELNDLKALENVLNKLHITEPLDLSTITEEQEKMIPILIETIGKGNTVKWPKQKNALSLCEIGNLNLLLWCAVGKNNKCAIGDFFDNTIQISYKYNNKERVIVSSYSYLQTEDLWCKVDNVDYDGIIPSAIKATQQNDRCFEMLNYDVLAMIKASDTIEETNPTKSKKLLDESLKLNEWLIENDPQKNLQPIHLCNKMQILKRQRPLSAEEIYSLRTIIEDNDVEDTVKVGACLLTEDVEIFDKIYATLSEDEQKAMEKYPIWRFCNCLIQE